MIGMVRRIVLGCLLIGALVAAPIGCGGGGDGVAPGTVGDIPGSAPTGINGYGPVGKLTWDELVKAHEAAPGSGPASPAPEGGSDEQTPPDGPHGVEGGEPEGQGGAPSTALTVDLPGFRALGQDISGGGPPDTMGAVGPNHVMTVLNTGVLIQDKLGNTISPAITLGAFFSAVPSFQVFDPRVQYDQMSGRWLVSANFDPQVATSGVCFAISDTDDPTGAWTFYAFDLDPADNNWADFVSMGFNGTWICLTTDAIQIGGGFVGEHMWVIDKASALSGGLLTVTQFTPGFADVAGQTARRMKPAVTFDPAEPTLYLASSVYNVGGIERLRISQINGTGGAPVWSVVPGSTVVPASGLFTPTTPYQTAGFGLFPGAPQMGGATLVDTGRGLLGSETVYRNGRLWICHTGGLPAVGAIARTAVFWYEVDPTNMPNPIVQSGVCDGGGGPPPNETITQNSEDSTITGGGKPGQSFTVSITGTITSFQWNPTGAYPAGTVDVYSGAGNGGALVASEAIGAGVGGVQTFNFAAPPAVTPGVYTIYVPAPNGGLDGIRAQSGNVYAGGIMYAGAGTVANTDMRFEVQIVGSVAAADWYYYPSLAVNARGDMCMGFSRSSANLFIEGVVTGRDFDDPPGTLDPLVVQKAGEGFYSQVFNGRNRWGDYSATCVDPSDDLTIWSIQEYAQAGNTYGTWWARHAIADALTLMSTLVNPVNVPFECSDPPAPGAPTVIECNSTMGRAITVNFGANAPSGSAFDVSFYIDGVLQGTQTALGTLPGPSMLNGSFNATLPHGGPYLLEVRADGGGGDLDVCQLLVTVVDTTPPTIGACPMDITAECTSPAGAVVNFTAPTATDLCDANPTVTCVPPSGSTFAIGVTMVTCTATDASGNASQCSFNVTVQDTTPPVVSFAINRSLIWSARSGIMDVLFTASATDTCDPSPQLSIAVHASEGNASDVSFTPGTNSVGLRAERDDAAVGRIYLIVVRATDAAGLTTEKCLSVIVPGQFTTSAIAALRNQGIADAATCEGAAGAPPAGYSNLLTFTNFP